MRERTDGNHLQVSALEPALQVGHLGLVPLLADDIGLPVMLVITPVQRGTSKLAVFLHDCNSPQSTARSESMTSRKGKDMDGRGTEREVGAIRL